MLEYQLRLQSLAIPEFESYSGEASMEAVSLMGFGNELPAPHHWTQMAGYADERLSKGQIGRDDNHSRLNCLVTIASRRPQTPRRNVGTSQIVGEDLLSR